MMAINSLSVIQVYRHDPGNQTVSFYWSLNNHNSQVTSLSIADDGMLGVSGSLDRTFVIWNLLNGSPLRKVDVSHSVAGCHVTPSGKFVAVTLSSGGFVLYEVETNVTWRTS